MKPRVAVIGDEGGLVEVVQFAASALGVRTEVYASLTELAVVGRPETLDVLILDVEYDPVTPEDLRTRIESLRAKPSVLLVTRSSLAPGDWSKMPGSVELVVAWDDGELVVERAVRALIGRRLHVS